MSSMEYFLSAGFYLCFGALLLGGIFSLLGERFSGLKIGRIIMSLGLLAGVLSVSGFFFGGMSQLQLADSGSLFFGKIVIDRISAVFFLLVSLIGLFSCIYGYRYILNEKKHYNPPYIVFLTVMFLLGMMLVVLADTPVAFLFFWEIMSVSSFLLVFADLKAQSIRPAIFYLVMTHLGAGAILAGFLVITSGNLEVSFSQMRDIVSSLSPAQSVLAVSLFFFGFGSKAGLFPFHGWLPEAHPQAPSHISALMSGVMLKVAVYGFIRMVIGFFPVLPFWFAALVMAVGLCTAVFGVFYSLIETDIKRILAFSSIENLGLIFAMLGLGMIARGQNISGLSSVAFAASVYQVVCHALFKSGLFMSAGVMGQIFHTRNIEKMGGLAKKFPLFASSCLILILTAAALPPAAGFISELTIVQSIMQNAISADLPAKIAFLAFLVCLGTVAGIAVFSMVRFFGIGFLAEPRSEGFKELKKLDSDLIIPIVFMSGIAVVMAFMAKLIFVSISDIINGQNISLQGVFNFSPFLLLVIFASLAILIYLAKKIGSGENKERLYHTWDCGQKIDSSMEYTATAFSAPIRFFFKSILRAERKVKIEPVVSTNPWIKKKSVYIDIKPVWDEYFYTPAVKTVSKLSVLIRKIQNGNIQFYIALILISLIVTAIVIL